MAVLAREGADLMARSFASKLARSRYDRDRYQRDRESILARKRAYYAANKERIKQTVAAYRVATGQRSAAGGF